jgi:alpha-mannosidase
MGYFTLWWREQTPARQEDVKTLVREGRLSFSNGGWCMADEAATTLSDQLDMTARGHAFLQETFNIQPRLGWQIDPFGHSMEQAGAFGVGYGFEGVVLGRMHQKDLAQRVATKTLEFRWGENKGSGTSFLGMCYGTGNYGPDGRNQKWDCAFPSALLTGSDIL